ncbi:MAG: mannose-1-phosphate guanylyltransferase/mannose-6-phosphate isomerase [Pseudomonadota bacterium]
MRKIIPVVLCGGSGTRLWPLSRKGFPKQFLNFSSRNSLFQNTVSRVAQLVDSKDDVLIITNDEHRFIALAQLSELGVMGAEFLLEPCAKNTAPALTLAALRALEKDDDPVLVVTPSDQTITDEDAFETALNASIQVAETGAIVVLGIEAQKPETGYGYIKHCGQMGSFGEYDVESFVEKPDFETAQGYVDSGMHSWNGGMFVLKARVWLAALAQFQPDMLQQIETVWKRNAQDDRFIRVPEDGFVRVKSESIDYAVIEKCPGMLPIKMVPLDAGWSDLGAWDAVWEFSEQDEHGNSLHGDAQVTNTRNSLVYASERMVRVAGLDHVAVIETADAVLVIDQHQSQDVKTIVAELTTQQREERLLHRKVSRPWGWYDCIDEGDRFKVKRIQVNPGASLSLQRHEHRAEHWIVVKGRAEVTCGSQVSVLTENQSTYIPVGEIHRLRNLDDIPLEIIEVQSGGYLGEDDIERLDDTYGRG